MLTHVGVTLWFYRGWVHSPVGAMLYILEMLLESHLDWIACLTYILWFANLASDQIDQVIEFACNSLRYNVGLASGWYFWSFHLSPVLDSICIWCFCRYLSDWSPIGIVYSHLWGDRRLLSWPGCHVGFLVYCEQTQHICLKCIADWGQWGVWANSFWECP